jgi:hypothetical protein
VNGCIQGIQKGYATFTGSEITLLNRRIFVVDQANILSDKREIVFTRWSVMP